MKTEKVKKDKKQRCEVCGKKIKVQIFKNTGICSGRCKDARDGKVPHPTNAKEVVE